MLSQLLRRDPSERLGTRGGAEEVKAHPFFKGVDWALLRWKDAPLAKKPDPPRADGGGDEVFEIEV